MELALLGIGAFLMLVSFGSERVNRIFQAPDPSAFRSRKEHPWVSRGAPVPELVTLPSLWQEKKAKPQRASSSIRAWAADNQVARSHKPRRGLRDANADARVSPRKRSNQ